MCCFQIVKLYFYCFSIHYPGARSPDHAVQAGRPLWASEDFSCKNDVAGGGCWARVSEKGVLGKGVWELQMGRSVCLGWMSERCWCWERLWKGSCWTMLCETYGSYTKWVKGVDVGKGCGKARVGQWRVRLMEVTQSEWKVLMLGKVVERLVLDNDVWDLWKLHKVSGF